MNTPWDSEPASSQNSRIFFKGLIIVFISAFLMAPTLLIQNLVNERQDRQQEAIKEVSSKWADAQTINGPQIAIPYWQTVADQKGVITRVKHKAYFLPEKLVADANVAPENRYRGIYQVTVYNTDAKLSGSFGGFKFSELGIADADVIWSEAAVYFSVSDVRGLKETLYLNWNGKPIELMPGKFEDDQFPKSLSAALPIEEAMRAGGAQFSISLKLKGSQSLMFVPLGKTTTVSMRSSWPNPSFAGNYLPDARVIKDSGFSATWNILSLNRSYPQQWANNKYELEGAAFGVDLRVPVDTYQKSNRSVKYAILCIILTFTAFFLIELVYAQPLNILQYVLVGLALCIFYTLLLSISEYLGFDAAYGIASVAVIGLIAWYVSASLKSRSIALFVSLLLLTMYGFVYILIQSQDYALLMGSIGLFVVLGIVMYFSRRIKALNAA